MNHSVEIAVIGAVTCVSVLVIAAMASAGFRIFHSVSRGLTSHDADRVAGPERTPRLRMAMGAAQRRLLTFGTDVFAAGVYTARNLTPSRRSSEISGREQAADRYAKAVEQLGSGHLDVRIGGIYALERLAHDSPQAHPAVMEVLTAFVRAQPARHSRRMTPPDVQAAITAMGRRRSRHDRQLVNLDQAELIRANLARANLNYADLTGADLTHADLTHADLTGADLTGANLTGADLTRANLTAAILRGVDLTRANLTRANLASKGQFRDAAHPGLFGADLTYANLTGANLKGADLTDAILPGADLTGAILTGAILRGADLARANLTHANLNREDPTGTGLFRANLPGADLTGANLTSANLTGAGLFGANLTGAGLFGACWPPDAATPAGWQRDAGSGRLRPAGTDPCDAVAD